MTATPPSVAPEQADRLPITDTAKDISARTLARRMHGTHDAVSNSLRHLEEEAGKIGICPALCDDLALVLGEVLNNIVEHALRDREDGWIQFQIRGVGDGCKVMIADNGRPLPPALLTGAALPEISEDIMDLPEGGFGWFIVHTMAGEIDYERVDGRNQLSFAIAGP